MENGSGNGPEVCFNDYHEILCQKNVDSRPTIGKSYFLHRDKPDSTKSKLSILIALYSENCDELRRTLRSIYYAHNESMSLLRDDETVDIIIIQDGWKRCHDSTKQYLNQIFYVYKYITEDNNNKTNYIFQTKTFTPLLFEGKNALNLTLLIKMENKSKKNSVDWFISPKNGFVSIMNSEYMMIMDTFTFLEKKSLYYFVKYMEKHPLAVAITGQQCTMSKEDQNINMFSLQWILSSYQSFEYQLWLISGLYFGLIGLQTCIHGPCGIYRSSIMFEKNIAKDWININADSSLILSNLYIGEDRLLTFIAINNTMDTPYYMDLISCAIFYTDPILSIKRFLLQRRRWINAVNCFFLYLIIKTKSKLSLLHSFNFIFSILYPFISMYIFYYSVLYFFDNIMIWHILITLWWILYFVYVLIHAILVNDGANQSIDMYLLPIMLFVSIIITVIKSIYGYIIIIENGYICVTAATVSLPYITTLLITWFPLNKIAFNKWFNYNFYLALFRIKSMICSLLGYYLFFEMYSICFPSYAHSRIWDLSWGSRKTSNNNKMMSKYYISIFVNISIYLFNIALYIYLPLKYFIILCATLSSKFFIDYILCFLLIVIRCAPLIFKRLFGTNHDSDDAEFHESQMELLIDDMDQY